MNFKEYVADDVKKTIINLNEFADEKNINGKRVRLLEDSDELEHRINKNYDGLIIGDVLFFISEEEYKKIPKVTDPPTANQSIRYEGRPALIFKVGKSEGLYDIIIQYTGG